MNNDRAMKSAQQDYDNRQPPEYWADEDCNEDEPDLTCPVCKGSGMDETGIFDCENCDGEGSVE